MTVLVGGLSQSRDCAGVVGIISRGLTVGAGLCCGGTPSLGKSRCFLRVWLSLSIFVPLNAKFFFTGINFGNKHEAAAICVVNFSHKALKVRECRRDLLE